MLWPSLQLHDDSNRQITQAIRTARHWDKVCILNCQQLARLGALDPQELNARQTELAQFFFSVAAWARRNSEVWFGKAEDPVASMPT